MSIALPTFTDEQLENYLSIWDGLIERGQKQVLEIELRIDCGSFAYPRVTLYTLTYGEEKRELTFEQWIRVRDWLDTLRDR